MFSTSSKDCEFDNFYSSFNFESENDHDMFHFSKCMKPLHESLSLTEIKSTEEILQRYESSSLSNVAEDNELTSFKDVTRPVDECSLEETICLNKLVLEIQEKINSSAIDELIEEVVDIQLVNETDFKDNLVILKKQKKSSSQKDVLEQKLKETPKWTSSYMKRLANQLNLKEKQVYKWYWDHTKKQAKEEVNLRTRKNKNQKFEDIGAFFGL